MKLTKKIIAIVLATLTILSTFAFAGCTGNPKAMAVKAVKASFNGDYKTLVSMINPKLLDELLEQAEIDKSDLKEIYKEIAEDRKEYNKDEEMKFTKAQVTKTDEKKNSEVKDYVANYEDYDYIKDLDLDVKDVMECTVKYYWKEDGDSEHEKDTMTFMKVGGKWYLGFRESIGILSTLRSYK